jgi:hypothetical protein
VRGPGTIEAKQRLDTLKPEQLVVGSFKNRDETRALLAALWLWHDWLDESHALSQQVHSSTGSFWHAIMHRREGDFSNSKYWYARCADHPVLKTIAAQAGSIVHPLPADKALLRLVSRGWSPEAFVDLVEAVHDLPDDPRHQACVRLQQLEWRVLFEHGTRAAAQSQP